MEIACQLGSGSSQVPSRSITAVSQVPRQSIKIAPETLRSAPTTSVVSTVLQWAGPPHSMIGDPCGPLGIGRRIRHRSGRYVGDLGTIGKQRLGVTRFAGAYASRDQDAAIRPGDVRIDQWSHR